MENYASALAVDSVSNLDSIKKFKPMIECPQSLVFTRSIENEVSEGMFREYCVKENSSGIKLRVGPFVKRDLTGMVRFQGQYGENGHRQGLQLAFDDKGIKIIQAEAVDGQYDGEKVYFRADGSVSRKEYFKLGKRVSGLKNLVLGYKAALLAKCTDAQLCFSYSIQNLAATKILSWKLDATVIYSGNVVSSVELSGGTLAAGKTFSGIFLS